ncbi:unnamed protein product [Prorocentrum cordatum]|uniref:HTH OST-type domain-containing protein n=1 Tax=Prorocentrum cordatum TaxID=2364126 RepID=A0ABN9XCP5_9DINO|nr:unnamed protein product [Polarella glacialis]
MQDRAAVPLEPTRRGGIGEGDWERPREGAVVYQGRASHYMLGTNIPMQVELFWTKHRASGTWFMLRSCVDVVAERTDGGHLTVRAASGGTIAKLLGKWVAPNRLAGDFHFGTDGGGAFELLQCHLVSVWAGSVHWASSRPSSGASSVDSLASLPVQEHAWSCFGPPPEQWSQPSVQALVPEAAAKEMDSQVIFTTEAQLANAIADVLRTRRDGVPLAQFKSIIHKSAGMWVSEGFLGYKKFRNLITSPTVSKVCCIQHVGSCDRVFGYETAMGQTRFVPIENSSGKQHHFEGEHIGFQPPHGLQFPLGRLAVSL